MWFNELQAVSTLRKRRVMESNLSMIFWSIGMAQFTICATTHLLFLSESTPSASRQNPDRFLSVP